MKKKLFILAAAVFALMPSAVNAAPPIPIGDNFGVNDKCKWSLDTNGAFTVEPVDTACELESWSKNIWSNYADQIESFTIKPGVKAPANMDQYFWKLTNVEEIDVNELDVSSTTSMNQVFTGVGSNATNPIAELNLSKWNTKNATTMGEMFSATNIKKLDISSFTMTNVIDWYLMFQDVGKDAKEGTEIILNSTFGGLAPSEFADYEFPYEYYTINGGDTFNLISLNNRIAQTTGKASLIPVFPFQIQDGSSIAYNKYNHRTGAQIDTSKIKNITPKDGFRLVKWTDTQDPKNATIEIPAGEQSTSTYADFYNTQNVLTPGITLYAQWEKDYKILKGENQTYILGSNQDVVIKTNGNLADLGKIRVDGADLDVADYDVADGSTILTLKASYLNSLSEGDHTVEFAYQDGTVRTNLRIARNTGGNTNPGGNTGGNTSPSGKTGVGSPDTGANTNVDKYGSQTNSGIMIATVVSLAITCLIGMIIRKNKSLAEEA